MNYSVLTPALVPDAARSWKKPNVGDQLILDSIEEHLGEHTAAVRLSSWQEIAPADIERINMTRALILAGANPLQDEYRIAPKMTLDLMRRIRVPILPFGVGLYGEPHKQVRMSVETAEMMREMHSRIEFSSWRCPRTLAYLHENLPDLAGKFLMTGCPVVQAGRATRTRTAPDPDAGTVAITVTERGPDWWAREMRILDAATRLFPGRPQVLVLHQKFAPTQRARILRRLFPARYGGPDDFHALARRRGLQVVCPDTTAEMRHVYSRAGVHFGSRLHAHLYFLSQNKHSFLFAVDGRAGGFGESLGFALLDGSEADLVARTDFTAVQAQIAMLWDGPMRVFLQSVRKQIA